MGVHHVADGTLQVSAGGGRHLERLGLVAGGVALLASFLFIGLTEHRALGIALGILAIVLAKTLYMKSPTDSVLEDPEERDASPRALDEDHDTTDQQ